MIRSMFIRKSNELYYSRFISANYRYYKAFSDDSLASKDPLALFQEWFEEARQRKDIKFPGVFCFATSTKNGFPSARFVALTSVTQDGFIFFTNYESRKANEIADNPNVAGSFLWESLNRSVTFQGQIEKIPSKESNAFFETRPCDAQIAILASHQSTPIVSKEFLREEVLKLESMYRKDGKDVPKPQNWGGYIIKPSVIEFWQGHGTGNQGGLDSAWIRFKYGKCAETRQGEILHEGKDEWVYEQSSS